MLRRSAPILLSLLCAALWAPSAALAVPVDVELSLLIDVSGSIDPAEFNLQRQGYVDAFNNPALISAIQAGPIGKIAVNLVYWSGIGQQVQAVPWTLVEDTATSNALAALIAATAQPYMGLTAIGEALAFGAPLFDTNGYEGTRRTIDVSGDGATNDGRASSDGRDFALGQGIYSIKHVDTINGLVILGEGGLLAHYQTQVIGGPDSFAVAVAGFPDFGAAVQEKLIREINPIPEPVTMLCVVFGLGGLGGYLRKRFA